jgi:hypothetical protein
MNIFISWSGDCAKDIAGALKKWLKAFFQGVEVWTSNHDIEPGTLWLTQLFDQLEKSQFGVLCITPENLAAPWLIFEAGAICHGLKDVPVVPYIFQVKPNELADPLKFFQGVSSDKDGTYSLVKSLNKVCKIQRQAMELHDAFEEFWPQLENKLKRIEARQDKSAIAVRSFCDRISGFWWERIQPDDSSALSYVRIDPDPATKTIRMVGRAFDKKKNLIAHWETMATCISEAEKKIYYVWKGWHPRKVSDPYEGFGELDFRATTKSIKEGHGFFSDMRTADIKSIEKKAIKLLRCTKREQKIMEEGSKEQKSDLVGKKMSQMN